MQSRSWDESHYVHLPHGHKSQPHVGCLRGISPSFKRSHIPLMNGFRRRRKTPLELPVFPGAGKRAGCGSRGEGGAPCFSSRTPSLLCKAWTWRQLRVCRALARRPSVRAGCGVPSRAGGTLLQRPDPLTAFTTIVTVPWARPRAPPGKRVWATLFAYTQPIK